MKPEKGGLGLLICELDHLPGVYVKEIVKHKAAYNNKRVRASDKILAVNGLDTSNATQNYVVDLLKVGVVYCAIIYIEQAKGWGLGFLTRLPKYEVMFSRQSFFINKFSSSSLLCRTVEARST